MKSIHIPRVDARYWCAIALASLFGTNLGDLWAHNSGLNKLVGLIPLTVLAAIVFALERRDRTPREAYYWLVIAIIRTGATNIADYFKKMISWPLFGAVLAVAMIATAILSLRHLDDADPDEVATERQGMPRAGAAYWSAMLSAGVLGTFYGDVASKTIGKPMASLSLLVLLLCMIGARTKLPAYRFWLYWLVVAVARTFGTAAGDLLADDPRLDIGLGLSTLITGLTFLAVLTLWSRGRVARSATA